MTILINSYQKRDSGNDREKGVTADINKGNKCDKGTKNCAKKKRNLPKLPKIAENGRAQKNTRKRIPPPNCQKSQNWRAQKIMREKKTSKNCQKLLKLRAQKLRAKQNFQKISKKLPSWRGHKIPPQAKICNNKEINK